MEIKPMTTIDAVLLVGPKKKRASIALTIKFKSEDKIVRLLTVADGEGSRVYELKLDDLIEAINIIRPERLRSK